MKRMPKKTPIYRIFKVEYLYKMIKNKENTLAHISQWEDPLEGYLFKQKIQRNGEPVGLKCLFKDYYGQCWSYTNEYEETSIRWPIYSPDKHGILVKSTFGKLWNSFYNNPRFQGEIHNLSCVTCAIGRVEYPKESSIIKKFESIPCDEIFGKDGIGLIKSLLIKRKEFKYEKEIRIIFNDNEKLNLGNGETMRYPIKPEDIFCLELIADPRMPDSCFEYFQSFFKRENFTLQRTPIYNLPDLNIQC